MGKKINDFSSNQNTLHFVTRPLLMAARCSGIFPVSGLMSRKPNKLRFIVKSPYTIIVLLSVLGQTIFTLLSYAHLFKSGTDPLSVYKIVLNSAGWTCTLLIIRLAKHWPKIMMEVSAIEKSLPKYQQKNVTKSCWIAITSVTIGAIVDCYLKFRFNSIVTAKCFENDYTAESYYIYTMPASAAYISYALWKFILLEITNIQIVFVSNFTDILVTVISFYLTAHFEELNSLVFLYKNKSPSIWNVLRGHYTKLARLVKLLDDNINSLILFSFGSNMAIICVQIFKLLRNSLPYFFNLCDDTTYTEIQLSADRAVSFNFSIAFLLLRAILTFFVAARVQTTARVPLQALYEVPSCCYSSEARRFVEQMHANVIALSGQHFFYVTRGMILSMVATIFTYELVLLQFSYSKS